MTSIRIVFAVLLCTSCTKKVETTALPPLSATVDEVPRAGDTPALRADVPTDQQSVPVVLHATEAEVGEMALVGTYPNTGQLWRIADADVLFDGDAVVMSEPMGAAAFEADGPAPSGSWAVGCARVRSETLSVAPLQTELGELYPLAEIVPGTLLPMDSEPSARVMVDGLEACSHEASSARR